MSATESATKIGDITLIIGGGLHTGIIERASASGSRPHVLGRPGAHPGVMQIVASAGRTCNREDLNSAGLSVRGRISDRAPVNKAEGAKWPPVANEGGAVAAPLADQAVGISSGGRVNVACPAGVQASEGEVEDTVEVVGAVEVEVVEDNERDRSGISEYAFLVDLYLSQRNSHHIIVCKEEIE